MLCHCLQSWLGESSYVLQSQSLSVRVPEPIGEHRKPLRLRLRIRLYEPIGGKHQASGDEREYDSGPQPSFTSFMMPLSFDSIDMAFSSHLLCVPFDMP